MINKSNTLLSYPFIILYLILLVILLSNLIEPYIHIYTSILIIITILIFFIPEFSYAFYITDGLLLSTYFFVFKVDSISILPTMILFLLFGILLSNNYFYNFFKDKQNRNIILIAFFLGLYILIRSFNGVGGDYGYIKSYSYFLRNFVFLMIPILFFYSDLSLKKIHYAGVIISIIIIFLSLLNYLQLDYASERLDPTGRHNVIWFGRAMALSIVWFYYTIVSNSKYVVKIISIIMIVLAMFLLNVTGSRGPLLSLVLSFLLFIFFTKKYGFKTKFVLLGFISILIIPGFTYLFTNIMNRFTSLSTDVSALIRIYAIYHGILLFFQKPFFGWGTGSFASIVNEFIKYPHNIFVELSMETGIIGLILFILFLVIVIYNMIALRKKIVEKSHSDLLNLSFLIFFLAFFNSQLSGDIAHNPLMWFSAGCVLVLRKILTN